MLERKMDTVILSTPRFDLMTPVREEDFDQITKIKSNPLVSSTQLYGTITSRGKCRSMFHHYIDDAYSKRRKRWVFGIYTTERFQKFTGIQTYIGNVGLERDSPASTRGSLFFEVDPEFWGLGIASECLARVIAFAWEKEFSYLMVDPMVGNEASIRVAKHNGFRDTGRKIVAYNGVLQHLFELKAPK
ncbi:N-acetyltransferase [Schizosaccharomyces japonicus yFS275]|uniref:N-acetyltransferase n=1 Tax=Schizosaccharomyces japonicus (strain yFS275 / FY16936) TaxID=402676 RepID=B6JXB5_SCHJY|nr:N-acetyltransferase [Schizosaccharomyces japonicus yFS275]EEB06016.2 N-acetyltransferase [Schizosaccharomyces japonicus yFS275]